MPLTHLLKNKLLLQKNFNLQEVSIDNWPYWMFEENIKLVNDILEEEEDNRKTQEQQQSDLSGMNNFDTGSMMRDAKNMTSKLK